MKHTLAFADDAKKTVSLGDRPVHTNTMTNDIAYIERKVCVYDVGSDRLGHLLLVACFLGASVDSVHARRLIAFMS